MLPTDIRIAEQVTRQLAQWPVDDREAALQIIAGIASIPIRSEVGVPWSITGDGFLVLYEIGEDHVANVTTCRRTPPGYPQRM